MYVCCHHYNTQYQVQVTFSLSSNTHTNGVVAPKSSICDPMAMQWFMRRVISPNSVRINLALGGMSIPISLSMAREYACSLHIMDT